MAKKKVSDNYISSYSEDWGQDTNDGNLPFSGTAVQKFIKDELQGKVGYVARSQSKIQGFYHLYGFKNEAEYNSWVEDSDSVTPIFDTQLPNADTYSVNLATNSNTTKLVNLGDGVKVNLRYTSTSTTSAGVETDTEDEGTLTIQRSYDGGSWTTVATQTVQPQAKSSTGYDIVVDITNYLLEGDNKIRMRVTDDVNGSVSANVTFNSVVNTTLSISNALDVATPINTPSFSYFIQGQIEKTIHLKITPENSASKTYEYALGTTTYKETPYNISIDDTYNTGTVDVEAWLTVDNTTLESEHISNQFYYINGSSTDPVIILNNQVSSITNFVNIKFFDFALYNKKTNVIISIDNGAYNYLSYTYENQEVNTTVSFYNTLEIESSLTSLDAIVSIYLGSKEGTPAKTFSITIDNSENMNPTTGADFILNPKIRSNSEASETRVKIINSVDNSTISSTWDGFSFQNDGWILDDDGIGVLRLLSGSSINIEYDPLDSISSSTGTTIEFDFKVYNVFNDNEDLLSFKSTSTTGNVLGFQMNTTEAYFLTNDNQVIRDQDVMFQDETRTHLAINIIPNLSNSGLNYIRIFINGIMNREILYKSGDVFKIGTLSINIAPKDCDFDIYSIRVYKKSLSASDIRQDYMSCLPTSTEKIAFRNMNAILSDDGTISFDKASAKYNTLTWIGQHPEYTTGDVKYTGSLEINILNDDLTQDKEHSGTITNLQIKGQGSSSKTYYRWNHQYDMNKIKDKNEDGTNKLDADGEQVYKDSVWTDGNGKVTKNKYTMYTGDPAMKKMVAKLNWASSMQSHKIGSTALYNDLWKEVVGGSGITNYCNPDTNKYPYSNCRVAVRELPFLYFFKETEKSQPVFGGFVTFGAGKADKPTFGIDINKLELADGTKPGAKYMLIEGSDNGKPLTMRLVPWIDEDVTYNPSEEYYEYNGEGSWDFDAGKTDTDSNGVETPKSGLIDPFKNAVNFIYQLNPNLLPDTIDDSAKDVKYQYWNTTTYNVKRYDYITKTWVNAGLVKNGEGNYSTYNILNQEEEYITKEDKDGNTIKVIVVPAGANIDFESKDPTTGLYIYKTTDGELDINKINDAFISYRKNIFKEYIGNHYHKNDALFSMAMVKLLAASDNWCKNTYEYYDPIDKLIRFDQDDLDTIMLTDNVGRKNKPYYVEEHDTNSLGEKYWNSDDNIFFSLMEEVFADDYKAMMTSILKAMVKLYGSVDKCLQHYYFDVQEYFPAVAYNETARLLYETAAVSQNSTETGHYTNNTTAISQSLGDQLQAEKQWWKRRIPYMQSWARSNPFNISGQSSGSLSFRSVTRKSTTSDEMAYPDYTFTLTPWQWLYPKVGVGQTSPLGDTRVEAGDEYTSPTLSADGNTNIFIYGSDYYTNYGEFGNVSLGEAFPLNGAHLLEFSADSRKVDNYYFRPSSISVACPSLKKLTLYGASTITGSLDLSKETKLESVDIAGTNITGIILPESYNLKEISFPATVSSLTLNNCPNVDVNSWSDEDHVLKNILSLSTDNSVLAMKVLYASENLNTITFTDVELDLSGDSVLSERLYNALVNESSTCSGIIALNKTLTTEEKNKLVKKYNSIDDPEGSLYITYTTVSDHPTLSSDSTIAIGKKLNIDLTYNGNDVKKYTWTVEGAESYVVNTSGVTITAYNDESYVGGTIKVTCTVLRIGNTSESVSKVINIIDAIKITNIIVNDAYIHDGNTVVPITYDPSNYTIDVDKVSVNTGSNLYISYSGCDTNKITYELTSIKVTNKIKLVYVNIEVTDVEDKLFKSDITLYVDNPITSWSIIDENENETNLE